VTTSVADDSQALEDKTSASGSCPTHTHHSRIKTSALC